MVCSPVQPFGWSMRSSGFGWVRLESPSGTVFCGMGACSGSLPVITGGWLGLVGMTGPSSTVRQPADKMITPRAAQERRRAKKFFMGKSSVGHGDQIGRGLDGGLDPGLGGSVDPAVTGAVEPAALHHPADSVALADRLEEIDAPQILRLHN